MALGTPRQDFWAMVMTLLKFTARIPMGLLIAVATFCVSYLGFWFLYRFTVFVYNRWLAHPW